MERERLWQELAHSDRFGYLPHTVRGFLDAALWDQLGKATNLPVFRLIGGFRDRIPCNRSIGISNAVGQHLSRG